MVTILLPILIIIFAVLIKKQIINLKGNVENILFILGVFSLFFLSGGHFTYLIIGSIFWLAFCLWMIINKKKDYFKFIFVFPYLLISLYLTLPIVIYFALFTLGFWPNYGTGGWEIIPAAIFLAKSASISILLLVIEIYYLSSSEKKRELTILSITGILCLVVALAISGININTIMQTAARIFIR